MKQKLILFALLIFSGIIGPAKQIDESIARQVGQNFLSVQENSNSDMRNSSLELVYRAESVKNNLLIASETTTLMYVFNTGSKGFVIVSGTYSLVLNFFA